MGHGLSDRLKAELVHDGGHTLIGWSLAAALWIWAGFSGPAALIVGCIVYPLTFEFVIDYLLRQMWGRWPTRDSLHDILTYQPAWIPYFLFAGDWLAAGVVAFVLADGLVLYYRGRFRT